MENSVPPIFWLPSSSWQEATVCLESLWLQTLLCSPPQMDRW